MAKPRWYEKLLDTTRGKILALLRVEPRTVTELAERLDLSGNAVRRHLTALERDGLVETTGVRREGVGKPARVYAISDEARSFFPRPYRAVLSEVLTVLEERESPEAVEGLLRETGRSLAEKFKLAGFPTDVGLEDRIQEAVRLLEDLGGVPHMERRNGHFGIVGESCVLSGIVEHHPAACCLAQALLEGLLDARVTELCCRNGRPRCVFEVAAPADRG